MQQHLNGDMAFSQRFCSSIAKGLVVGVSTYFFLECLNSRYSSSASTISLFSMICSWVAGTITVVNEQVGVAPEPIPLAELPQAADAPEHQRAGVASCCLQWFRRNNNPVQPPPVEVEMEEADPLHPAPGGLAAPLLGFHNDG